MLSESYWSDLLDGLTELGVKKNSKVFIKPLFLTPLINEYPNNIWKTIELVIAACLSLTGHLPQVSVVNDDKFKVRLDILRKKWMLPTIDLKHVSFHKVIFEGCEFLVPAPIADADFIIGIVPVPSRRNPILPMLRNISDIEVMIISGSPLVPQKYILQKIFGVSFVKTAKGNLLILSNLAPEMDMVLIHLADLKSQLKNELHQLSLLGNTNLRKAKFLRLPLFQARNIFIQIVKQ